MNDARPYAGSGRAHKAIRGIALTNFGLVAICILPATRNLMEQIFRALSPYPLLPWLFDLWIVGSTLFASALFAWELRKRGSGGIPAGHASRMIAVDGLILVAWWATLLVICAYAFMLGMGAVPVQ